MLFCVLVAGPDEEISATPQTGHGAAQRPGPTPIKWSAEGPRPFNSERRVPMKRFRVDQVSASLSCLRKKILDGNAWLIARKRSTLRDARSKCDADLEPTHSQNSSRYCCYGRGGIFVRATGVETIRLEPNFNTLQRPTSFGAKRGIKLGNRRNVYG